VLARKLFLAEDEWFAAGMPDSPFAVPGFDVPVRE
jgi:hypothetical protein